MHVTAFNIAPAPAELRFSSTGGLVGCGRGGDRRRPRAAKFSAGVVECVQRKQRSGTALLQRGVCTMLDGRAGKRPDGVCAWSDRSAAAHRPPAAVSSDHFFQTRSLPSAEDERK